jgi:acyl carrier protein
VADAYTTLFTVLTDLGVPAEEIRPDATFVELDLDSLALIELSVVVEERTGIRVLDLTPGSTLAEAAAVLSGLDTGRAPTVPPSA